MGRIIHRWTQIIQEEEYSTAEDAEDAEGRREKDEINDRK
jgi:hypothetical protein